MFDTHCHLDVPAFDQDRAAVFSRAHAAGVSLVLNPAYDLLSSRRAVALAQSRDDLVAAIGVHPNDTGEFGVAELSELRQIALAARPAPETDQIDASARPSPIAAIGEIGLDYHWKTVGPDKQAEAFVMQLGLARELELPVIIHCRDAYDDCLHILREHGQGLALVMHSFAGKLSHLRAVLDLGYYIGIGGPVTYPSAHTLRDCVEAAPLDRLVIETDAPYLAPQTWRGKRNEPAYIGTVVDKIAAVRHMSAGDIARMTMDNGRRLFRLV